MYRQMYGHVQTDEVTHCTFSVIIIVFRIINRKEEKRQNCNVESTFPNLFIFYLLFLFFFLHIFTHPNSYLSSRLSLFWSCLFDSCPSHLTSLKSPNSTQTFVQNPTKEISDKWSALYRRRIKCKNRYTEERSRAGVASSTNNCTTRFELFFSSGRRKWWNAKLQRALLKQQRERESSSLLNAQLTLQTKGYLKLNYEIEVSTN